MNDKQCCRICGCTWDNACIDEIHGPCWWVDEVETTCSHCYYGWNHRELENEEESNNENYDICCYKRGSR